MENLKNLSEEGKIDDVNLLAPVQNEEEKLFMEKLVSVPNKDNLPTGCLIDGKYEVLQFLGNGAYGNVFKVKDRESGFLHAIKVLKKDMLDSPAWREVEILSYINGLDPYHTSFTVHMFRAFCFHNHLCILYELLGPTVYHILRLNNRVGFSMFQIRDIAYQVAVATDFLHTLRLIHHDIKPDNIAFVHPSYDVDKWTGYKTMRHTNVKLIDFGSTIFFTTERGKVGTTLSYRSPEVGLHYNWKFRVDVWSLGCTLFEMYTGHRLFECSTEEQKCYMIEAIFCQSIPPAMGKSSKLTCFDGNGRLKYGPQTNAKKIQKLVKPFEEYIDPNRDILTKKLYNLLRRIFIVTPEHRIGSDQILADPFFTT